MAQSYFPLRWESTGDQWWYASPIDWAAANGHYDLVRELLHLDTNLLIKLTSLRRIRRLETVWDDDSRFVDAAKCRSHVARNLLLECEMKNRRNSLIRAGYGGWLLYTAASAGDMAFVQELLERDPLLVFGEGEFGVTDIFYAASRSKNTDVFRLIFDFALSPRCSIGGGGAGEIKEGPEGNASVFRWEMVNRALHATSRGGNLEILRELLDECSDILAYRDVQGSTILHSASARGQVEVVKYLIAFYTIINSTDNQGSTALHVAAYRGHPPIVEAIARTCPSSSSLTNNSGDTFLHAAVAGFRAPGFRRLDRQMELMKQLVSGIFLDIKEIINIPNNDGRTALHMALIGNMHSDLVELLMTIPSIDLNIRDANGMTPLDILNQRPRSALSEILIKQLISAGGLFNSKDFIRRSAIASQLKLHVVGNSPGTSFKVSDSEIFLYTGIGASEDSGRPSSCSTSKSELTHYETTDQNHDLSDKKQNAVNNAARRLKIFLRWPRHKENKAEARRKLTDDDSVESLKKWCERKDTPPTPLRQRFSKASASLPNNKRVLSVRNSMPSPAMKKKFTSGLMHGVMQAMPHLAPQGRSPSTTISRSSMSSSPVSEKQKGICLESEAGGASCSSSSVNTRNRNHYFCFGAKGLAMDGRRSTRMFKRSIPSVA